MPRPRQRSSVVVASRYAAGHIITIDNSHHGRGTRAALSKVATDGVALGWIEQARGALDDRPAESRQHRMPPVIGSTTPRPRSRA